MWPSSPSRTETRDRGAPHRSCGRRRSRLSQALLDLFDVAVRVAADKRVPGPVPLLYSPVPLLYRSRRVIAARLPRGRGGSTFSTHRPTRGSKFVHADLPPSLEVVDDGRGRWHLCLSHDPRPTRFLVPGVGRVLLYSLRFNTHRRGKLRLGQRGGGAATGPASADSRRFGADFDAAKVTHWGV